MKNIKKPEGIMAIIFASIWLGWRRLLLLSLLICCLLKPQNSSAQYTKLSDLGGTPNGANPYGTPLSDGTYLYGMTAAGGSNNLGTIYKIKLDGTGFTRLLDFDGTNGSNPYGSLYSDGTFLYGMTSHGGLNSQGIIFKIKPDGTGFINLLDFSYGVNGAYPFGSFISDGTFLYGMTSQGGPGSYGTVFKIKPDGTGYSSLLSFNFTNGAYPYGSLYRNGAALYAMTSYGGANNGGTLFTINTDGTGFNTYFNFTSGGNGPKGSLVSDGAFLYGMTYVGGILNNGQIFKISLDGSSGLSGVFDFQLGSSGAYPVGSLVYDGSFLYGMTTQGITSYGALFKVATDGSGYTKLLDIDMYVNASNPQGTLFWDGASTFYGVRSGIDTGVSGISYLGTIFKINSDGSNYTKLYNYEAAGNSPEGSFVAIGTTLYATSFVGGLYNYGTIFKINTDGSGYTKVLDFDGTKGKFPHGTLIFDGTYLYGTTTQGGSVGSGVVFKVKPDGTGFVDLLDFDDTNNGGDPRGALLFDGTYLYGMTTGGGANSYGTVFKLKTDGSSYSKLIDLDFSTQGANPYGSLIDLGGVLYGLTSTGGVHDWGALFKVNKDGTGFTKLYDFNTATGSTPYESLYSDGTYLYGTTSAGGANSIGTIFKVKPDGTGYTILLDFDGVNNGSTPKGSLISDDGVYLYGMTSAGGALGYGTVFRIKTDGTGFLKLYDFNDGKYPQRSFLSDGTFLYGLTEQGGANAVGTVFKISKTPFVSVISFDPVIGAPGTIVTIAGTNFDPVASNNVVKFNNTIAVVKSSTATTIVAIVPAGATDGPISVTAGTTGTSVSDFLIITNPELINGSVQSCNFQFTEPNSTNDLIETFLPVNPGDKIQVSFSAFSAPDDQLKVYDGPTTASPLIATLNGKSLPADIVATGAGGELTFQFLWGDGLNSSWVANITCVTTSLPVITAQSLATQIGGKVILDLKPLIATANLDLTSLQVVTAPSSGAIASIDTNGILTVDYTGKNFAGTESITIQACDVNGQCATQDFSIEVVGNIIVYNGISPNGANPMLVIKYIDLLPDTQKNTVYIFDRWENQVWHGVNYNNTSVVFTGTSDGGSELPTGVYYYKIVFDSGRKTLTGFISLRRQ